jgi:hypothetical protein
MGKRTMASKALRFAAPALLCLWGAAAQAAPDNGFGVYLGPVSSNDSSIYGTGRGFGIGVDAQFMVNDSWSLNPYLLISSETTDRSFDVVNGEGGLQARYWMGPWFVGGQFLFHDMLLKQGGTVSTSDYSGAVGLAAGWESSSRWSVVLEMNALEKGSTYSSSGNNRSDVLLLVGYHWY